MTDSGNHRIYVLTNQGTEHPVPGLAKPSGSTPGHFLNPVGVAVHGVGEAARLFVSEWVGRRIQVLSLDGASLQVAPNMNT